MSEDKLAPSFRSQTSSTVNTPPHTPHPQKRLFLLTSSINLLFFVIHKFIIGLCKGSVKTVHLHVLAVSIHFKRMYTCTMNVQSSSFDQKVLYSTLMKQQWGPHRSVGCRIPVWRPKKKNNSWRSATFQYHLACDANQRGERTKASFARVA